jgi:predicted nuclease of restriction endonuclease-like (RecB) superfamily
MTKRQGWSKAVLIHKIELKDYERTLSNQTNFDKALPQEMSDHAQLAVKDEYMFGFLELGEQHQEHELEQAIVKRVGPFLREMGGAFTFVGNQFKIEVGDKEFFIDLLLYHRKLKCLVAIELKVVEFMPEHLGKMQFYLAALDDMAREEGENPSIGILLFKSKDRLMVEYTLRDVNRPIGVATYKVVETLPEDLKKLLPGPAQIAKLLEEV